MIYRLKYAKSESNFDADFEHPTLQGALFATHKNPGRCPGLRASALSGRAAYIGFLAFRACCLYWLLGLQGVLLILASCLQGVLLILASWPSGRAAYIGFLPSGRCCFSAVYVMCFFDNLCFLLFFHRKLR